MNGKAFVGAMTATLLLCAAAQVASNPADGPPAADNTAANASDRNSEAATPLDQSNSADAIQVTANIRKAIVGDKTLSTSAHNVKIVTNGNTVTLRGPVASTAEKERITALARQYARGKDVLDQLTVNGV
jgi:hyperosmotically inducible periplasmic protein